MMVVMLNNDQWNKVREILMVELQTEQDLLNNSGNVDEHQPVINDIQMIIQHGDTQVEDTLERDIIQECVVYVHDMCLIDQGTIDQMCEHVGCAEDELFDGFESISQTMGFELQEDAGV